MPNKDTCLRVCIGKHTHILLKILAILIIIIIAFALGKLAGLSKPDIQQGDTKAVTKVNKNSSYQQGYQDAMDAVNKRLAAIGMLQEEVLFLGSATVKSVNGQNIVVEFNGTDINILNEGMMTKTVKVPSGVSIEQRINKSQEEIDKLLADYAKNVEKLAADSEAGKEVKEVEPPVTYTIKNLKPSDLKPGDILSIESKTDISSADTFEASSIELIFIAPQLTQ